MEDNTKMMDDELKSMEKAESKEKTESKEIDELQKNPDEVLDKRLKKVIIRGQIWSLIRITLVLIIFVFILSKVFFAFSYVSDRGVEPEIQEGSIGISYRLAQSFQKDDLVTVSLGEDEEYVRRVTASTGDVITVSEGELAINGVSTGKMVAASDAITYPYTLKNGEYFVMADSEKLALDSRNFGVVTEKEIVGKVWFVIGKLF